MRRLIARILTTCLIFAFAILVASETYALNTSDFQIHSNQSSDQGNPSIAFDSNNKHFLITWHDYRNGNWDIYGRLVNADGSFFGSDIQITSQSTDESEPSVSFDPNNNRFLVTWVGFDDHSSIGVFGRLINADGSLYGSEIQITETGSLFLPEYNPSVAFDNVNNRFLIIWNDRRPDWNWNLYGRLVNADGSLYGSEFGISSQTTPLTAQDGSSRFRPSVAFDPVNQRFLAVWVQYPNDFIFDSNNPEAIYGRLINSDSSFLGSDFRISKANGWPAPGMPDVVYDSVNGRFFAIWYYNYYGNADIYGNLINGVDGSILNTSDITVTNHSVDQRNPSIAYDSINGRFLATWIDNRYGNYDIYGRLIQSDGVLNNTTLMHKSQSANQAQLAVAFDNLDSRFLLTWEDFRSGNADIYGRLFNNDGSYAFDASSANLTVRNQTDGSILNPSNWHNYFESSLKPYFSWDFTGFQLDPNNPYKVYFGTNASATALNDGAVQISNNYSPTALTGPSINYLKVIAKDINGNYSSEASITYKYDGTPPDSTKQDDGTAFKVEAKATGNNQTTVSWPLMFDNTNSLGAGTVKYYLYRKSYNDPDIEASYKRLVVNNGADEWVNQDNPLTEKAITDFSYTDSLAAGQVQQGDVLYNYKVRGIDAAENISNFSLASLSLPAAPTPGIAEPSTNSIKWHFTDNSNIEDGFILTNSRNQQVGTASQNASFIEQTGLLPNSPADPGGIGPSLIAYNQNGQSEPKTFGNTWTLTSPPAWVQASDGSYDYYPNKIAVKVANLSNDNYFWNVIYRVYRDGPSGNGTLVYEGRVDPGTIGAFIDTVTPGSHTYYVYSANGMGNENPDFVLDTGYAAVAPRITGQGGWHTITGYSEHDPDAGKWSENEMPHKGLQDSSNQCKVCHAVHDGASDSFKLLRDNSRLTECDFCHDVTGALTAIYYKPYSLANPKGEHTIGAKGIPQSNITTTNIEEEGLSCGNCHSVHDAWTLQRGEFEWTYLMRRDPGNNGGDIEADGLNAIQPYDNDHKPIIAPSTQVSTDEVEVAFCADCHNKLPNWDRGINNPDGDENPNSSAHRIGNIDGIVDIYGQRKSVSSKMTSKCQSCHSASTWVEPSAFPHQSIGHKLLDDDYTDTSEYLDNGGSGGYTGDPTRPLPNLDEKVCRTCHSQIGIMDDPDSF